MQRVPGLKSSLEELKCLLFGPGRGCAAASAVVDCVRDGPPDDAGVGFVGLLRVIPCSLAVPAVLGPSVVLGVRFGFARRRGIFLLSSSRDFVAPLNPSWLGERDVIGVGVDVGVDVGVGAITGVAGVVLTFGRTAGPRC